ncbi:hypothetical protein BDDG_04278 [Blastomyces dermatitidis ATCC 18188]|uniref:Uncharacterized protein n=1 Tax=Ajellomyces dermatitidis (strain ATCC 18188 / CBS 674.68) TaxID=653446 RepID=F2TDM3_AJEDA|nr:hypothetical protein BDDG_04278 [Blastomyces dermatitidis ATCC 18188]
MAGPSMQDPAQAPERSEANATAALASSAIGSEPMRRVRRKKGVRGGAISTGGPRGGAWVDRPDDCDVTAHRRGERESKPGTDDARPERARPCPDGEGARPQRGKRGAAGAKRPAQRKPKLYSSGGTHTKKCMGPDQMGPNVKFMVPPASLGRTPHLRGQLT